MKKQLFSRVIAVSCFVAAMFLSPVLQAETATSDSPIKRVEEKINELQSFINENQDKLSEKELSEKLTEKTLPIFDFGEMSKRCLGAHWRAATSEERTEFVDVFSSLLTKTYLKKIREGLAESEVEFVGERVKKSKAIVKTLVQIGGEKVSIDYRLRNKKNQWKIYDVIIENVGIITNYRSEFAIIVRKKQIKGLIEDLKEKQAQNKAKEEEKAKK